jgi:hypothetical protein
MQTQFSECNLLDQAVGVIPQDERFSRVGRYYPFAEEGRVGEEPPHRGFAGNRPRQNTASAARALAASPLKILHESVMQAIATKRPATASMAK